MPHSNRLYAIQNLHSLHFIILLIHIESELVERQVLQAFLLQVVYDNIVIIGGVLMNGRHRF